MTISLDVMDLENYPGTTKRVTLDSETLVPVGVEGDEKYMLSASTTAYSDNAARTSIQNLYIAGGKLGWVKSSGFAGINGKFALDDTNKMLGVKMDATVSGTDGMGYYAIELYQDGLALKGEDIAADMQAKLRAVECSDIDVGFQLAYKNCSVKFSDNKFHIASGTISDTLSGPLRSSVEVAAVSGDTCYTTLGFNQQVASVILAGQPSIIEAPLSSDYSTSSTTVTVSLLSGLSAGDAVCITDGNNTDYFIVEAFIAPNITVDSAAISNNYLLSDGAYVQKLVKTDPDGKTNNYYRNTDELLRYMAKIMINQIDFSS